MPKFMDRHCIDSRSRDLRRRPKAGLGRRCSRLRRRAAEHRSRPGCSTAVEALLTGPSPDEDNKALTKNLEIAARLLTRAREAVLRENRNTFNQSMIETVFEPGGIVRFFSHAVHWVGATNEITSKFKLKNRKHEFVSRQGTVY